MAATEGQKPSPSRLPVTLALVVLAPPLALVAWVLLSGRPPREYLRSPWIRAGIWLFVAGALPLLAILLAARLGLLSDPNPNPVGFGLLFIAGALVGSLAALVGVIQIESSR